MKLFFEGRSPSEPRPAEAGGAPSNRRGFLGAAAALLTGFLVGGRARAQSGAAPVAGDGIERRGGLLNRFMRQGTLKPLPLDTMVLLERGDNHTTLPNGTHEVLSLVQEERGPLAFPWTLFASLVTHHEKGDAVVLQSRLHKHGAGWSTGMHSEAFCHGRGVTLGANIEMHNDFAEPEGANVIGLNIQASEGEIGSGIQIQDGGGNFHTGIRLNGKGPNGLDMVGKYDVGINAHDNPIRLNEGACIELDGVGAIRVRYQNGRIEFLNGDKCFGHLDVHGQDHAL